MAIKKGKTEELAPNIGGDFVQRFWKESWTYIRTVVDVVREPILVLDKDLRVLAANEPFYEAFQVGAGATEGTVVYELGNGQWNIPALRRLLEDILPKDTFFKGFEVAHEFPVIGSKIMILNARRIYFKEDAAAKLHPPIILLAMEDVTEMMEIAKTLSGQENQVGAKLLQRVQKLEAQIKNLDASARAGRK